MPAGGVAEESEVETKLESVEKGIRLIRPSEVKDLLQARTYPASFRQCRAGAGRPLPGKGLLCTRDHRGKSHANRPQPAPFLRNSLRPILSAKFILMPLMILT